MSALILLRNESIKTGKRFAFWMTMLAFTGITTLIMLGQHQSSTRLKNPRPFELPGAWWGILEDPLQVGSLFGAVILVLLIASEFSWRTARQNVIDGLSKEQFFLGKLMLIPMIGLALFVAPLVVGPIVAALGEGLPRGGVITPNQLRYAGSLAVAVMGIGSIAFFFASTIRSTGSALGVFFLYIAFVERVLGMALGAIQQSWAPAARYFPFVIFQALMDPARWQPAKAAAAPVQGPPPLPTETLLAFAVGYLVLFCAAAFLLFRRRDL